MTYSPDLPLLHLAQNARWEEVDRRVAAGEDPCERIGTDRASAIAVFMASPDAGGVERLQRWAAAGVDLLRSRPDGSGEGGPLSLVLARHGRTDASLASLLGVLLDRGATWSGPDEERLLLMKVALFDRLESLNVLIAHGLPLHHRFMASDNYQPPSLAGRSYRAGPTDRDRTLLHLAVANGSAAMVQRCLDLGAEVNVSTESGMTPLHVAFLNRSVHSLAILRALLNAGAQADRPARGANGLTAQELGAHLAGTADATLWPEALRLHEQDQLRAAIDGPVAPSADRPRVRL